MQSVIRLGDARLVGRRREADVVAPAAAGAPAPTAGGILGLGTVDDQMRDAQTGALSLLSLRSHLEKLLEGFAPFGARPALMMIDIDRFAAINRAYGREVADEVLQAVGGRLGRAAVDGRAVYRTGGDEFAILSPALDVVDAVQRGRELLAALATPVGTSRGPVPLSVSVAVVMLGHRTRVDGILRDADATMFRAKTEGGNRVDVYNWEVDSWATARKRHAQRLEEEVEDLRRKNRMLAEAVTHDLLTGLPNAVAFDADHVQIDAWRQRSGDPYSVLRVRIDGLDSMRAHLRSPAGSGVLVSVAKAIAAIVRQSDRAYVIGDGEFSVLLRGSVMKQALGAAGRIRSGVADLAVADPGGSDRKVTVSIAAVEAGFRHSNRHEVVAEADRLLGDAAAGDSRIVWPH